MEFQLILTFSESDLYFSNVKQHQALRNMLTVLYFCCLYHYNYATFSGWMVASYPHYIPCCNSQFFYTCDIGIWVAQCWRQLCGVQNWHATPGGVEREQLPHEYPGVPAAQWRDPRWENHPRTVCVLTSGGKEIRGRLHYITLCSETRKRLLLFRFWSQTVRLCMRISPSSMYENAVTVLPYRMERTHRALVKISLIPSLLPSLGTRLSKNIVTLPLYAMHGSLLKNNLVPKLCKLMCPGVCSSDNL